MKRIKKNFPIVIMVQIAFKFISSVLLLFVGGFAGASIVVVDGGVRDSTTALCS